MGGGNWLCSWASRRFRAVTQEVFVSSENPNQAWSQTMFDQFVDAGVTLFPYIPDAGNKALIEIVDAHNEARSVLLTSEEEGVAVCSGADLADEKGVLCMQSSGVGNIPNFLTFVKGARFPILMMVSKTSCPISSPLSPISALLQPCTIPSTLLLRQSICNSRKALLMISWPLISYQISGYCQLYHDQY